MTSLPRLRLAAACALSMLVFAPALPIAADPAFVTSSLALRESGPQIYKMHISDVNLHVGERVQGHVETSPDVRRVEIHVGYWRMPLSRTAAGKFDGSGKIPLMAFFFRGKWTLKVVATGANGQEAERDLPITLR